MTKENLEKLAGDREYVKAQSSVCRSALTFRSLPLAQASRQEDHARSSRCSNQPMDSTPLGCPQDLCKGTGVRSPGIILAACTCLIRIG